MCSRLIYESRQSNAKAEVRRDDCLNTSFNVHFAGILMNMRKKAGSRSLRRQFAANKSDGVVRLIALFKLFKAILLLAVGLGVAALLHKGAEEYLQHWTTLLSVREENRYIRRLLSWLTGLNRRNLRLFEVSTFIYSGLLWTEAIGLLLLKRWAEYMTLIITASFIPLELYTEMRHFNTVKTLVLLINIAVVWYLARRLWKGK